VTERNIDLVSPDYPPYEEGVHPPYYFERYRNSTTRAPKRPLWPLERTVSELTGPLFSQELTVYLNSGSLLPRPKRNIGHVGATAPFGIYATATGYLTMAMFPCPELAKILGLPWLEQYDTNEKMYEHRDEVHERLSEHFRSEPRDHWLEVLSEGGVWCAPVYRYSELEDDPQIEHKDMIWEVPVGDDDSATFRTIGSPFTFSETPPALYRGVPRAGQDTQEYFPQETA
jgi:crotonobetainyl-CoA:carnitine CoA-transferase CaiB-like acyl-CoA transferase